MHLDNYSCYDILFVILDMQVICNQNKKDMQVICLILNINWI